MTTRVGGFQHAVELLLSSDDDAWVRADWARLADAGLPSRATATSPNAQPHVTVFNAKSIPRDVDAAISELLVPWLPFTARINGFHLFGDNPLVLTRSLELPTSANETIAEFRRSVASLVTPTHAVFSPHLTLSLRIRRARLTEALEVLQPAQGRTVEFVAVQRWDPDAGVAVRQGPS